MSACSHVLEGLIKTLRQTLITPVWLFLTLLTFLTLHLIFTRPNSDDKTIIILYNCRYISLSQNVERNLLNPKYTVHACMNTRA